MTKNNSILSIEPHKPEPFRIIEQELSIPLINVYLTGEIEEAESYYDLLSMFRTCPDNAIVTMYINSAGGDLFSTIQIINAMKDSRASITCILDGVAHSGASCIFLAGDAFVVNDGSAMLCHFYSGGTTGKGNEIKSWINFQDEYVKEFFTKSYLGFLTIKELEKMFGGSDFWFGKEEIESRLKKMVKRRAEDKTVEPEVICYDED